MNAFFRARLSLHQVEPYSDKYENDRERETKISEVVLTANTPGQALSQLLPHADSLAAAARQPDDNGTGRLLAKAEALREAAGAYPTGADPRGWLMSEANVLIDLAKREQS